MPRQFYLEGREYGWQFAPFENELIFNDLHAGWLEYISGDRCRLRKSPYSRHYSLHTYRLPHNTYLPEGVLIRFEVGRLIRERPSLIPKSRYLEFGDEFYEVLGWEIIEPKIIKPALSSDDFAARLIYNWPNGELDLLDKGMALEILSCPPGLYGIGGIGSQSFNVSSWSPQPLKDLKRTILGFLPREFKSGSRLFELHFSENKSEYNRIQDMRNDRHLDELSYNFLTYVNPARDPLPIQATTMIRNARYKAREKSFDPDVKDFILTAHYISPSVGDDEIALMVKGLRFVHDSVFPRLAGMPIPIDSHAIGKLAMALARFKLTPKLDESTLRESQKWLNEMIAELIDAREHLFKPGNASAVESYAMASYNDFSKGPYDLMVLEAAYRAREEKGLTEIPSSEIFADGSLKKISEHLISQALNNLVDRGRLLPKKNWTTYVIVEYDD